MSNTKEDQKKNKQSLKEQAINKKGNLSDGKKINTQEEQQKDSHQPRDNA